MISGTWMFPREDEAALRICRDPRESEAPRTGPERAQRWRLSPAYLLFLTALLSDRLWLCTGTRQRDKARGLAHEALLGAGTPSNRNSLCEPLFLGNLSRPAAAAAPHTLPCPGAPLDSACTKLYSLQRLWEALSPPSAPTSSVFSFSSKRNFLKAYFRNFSLPFCDSYSMADILLGMAAPESLDCSLDSLMRDFSAAAASLSSSPAGPMEGEVCGGCLRAYQRLDQHAQEKYEEFDSVLDKYLQSQEYSVRSCVGDCKEEYCRSRRESTCVPEGPLRQSAVRVMSSAFTRALTSAGAIFPALRPLAPGAWKRLAALCARQRKEPLMRKGVSAV
ncbi:hypothetical protein NDU88_000802 [Pleurodeles waltl]|uniref:Family with sequence similarity 155 member A n=1 Tax=Pleurodeles waltl TaxID=8319 RepID=A0AAV7V609_PLEWA|nr:hypothetical protein NDU88_000802 [Pleurodeles waltl]